MANKNPGQEDAQEQAKPNNAGVIAALVVIGLGIGWLAGLSVSPVISVVITSVIGVAATLVAALSGVKEEFLDADSSSATVKRLLKAVTPVPLAWVVVGLIIGASSGVWMRTHGALSPAPPTVPPPISLKEEIQQWVDLGLDQQEVVNKYFAYRVNLPPSTTPAVPASQTPTARDSVLFATAIPAECKSWQGLIDKGRYDDLVTEVKLSEIIPFRELPVIITDTVKLAAIIGEVLCADMQ